MKTREEAYKELIESFHSDYSRNLNEEIEHFMSIDEFKEFVAMKINQIYDESENAHNHR